MKENAATALLNRILDNISSGRMKPGMRFPAEPEMAKEYGVSRATLRQALKTLEAVGIIQSKPRVGTVLAQSDASAMTYLFGAHMSLAGVSYEDIARARLVLEESIARLAALNRTDQDLEKFSRALDLGDSAKDRDAILDYEEQFHTAMVESAHNKVLSAFRNIITLYFRMFRGSSGRSFSKKSFGAVLRQHWNIFNAVRLKQPEKSARLIRQHLSTNIKGEAHDN